MEGRSCAEACGDDGGLGDPKDTAGLSRVGPGGEQHRPLSTGGKEKLYSCLRFVCK